MKEVLKRLAIKLTSSRVIISAWVLVIISFIVFTGKTEFDELAKILCSVPVSYFIGNAADKVVEKIRDKRE